MSFIFKPSGKLVGSLKKKLREKEQRKQGKEQKKGNEERNLLPQHLILMSHLFLMKLKLNFGVFESESNDKKDRK
jgi:hypothetical protein